MNFKAFGVANAGIGGPAEPAASGSKEPANSWGQWVRSPLAGQVVDIRLVDVSVAGVTLEVVVDRRVGDTETQNMSATSSED